MKGRASNQALALVLKSNNGGLIGFQKWKEVKRINRAQQNSEGAVSVHCRGWSREDLRDDKAEEPWRKSHPGKHSNCFGFDHVASKMATPSFWGACSFLHCARSEHASFSAFLAHSRLKKIMKQQFERKR